MITRLLDLTLAVSLPPSSLDEKAATGLAPLTQPGGIVRFDWVCSFQQGPLPELFPEHESIPCGSRFSDAAASTGLPLPILIRHGAFNTIRWDGIAQVKYRLGRGTAEGYLAPGNILTPNTFRTGIFQPLLFEGLRGRNVFPLSGDTVLWRGQCHNLWTGAETKVPEVDMDKLQELTAPHSQWVVYEAHERALLDLAEGFQRCDSKRK